MEKFAKSTLTVDGNNIHVSMPFAKVDVEKRTVSGFATLDNIDSQGDVVLAEASAKAFSKARGNLREMHEKIAVGRVIDFREEEFLDQATGDLYRGIYVTAYISKGAENTWEKVLDKTLTGFSIGGEINDASSEFVKEANKTVRFIKDYDLVELSLVDNPANQLANIFSIQKVADGSVNVEGMVADTVIESVFMCKHDDTIVVKAEEEVPCPVCTLKMENIGWFETGPDRAAKVREIVAKFLAPSETEVSTSEGGVEMAKSEEEVKEVPDAVPAGNEGAEEEADRDPDDSAKVESAEVDETEGTEGVEDVEEVEDEESTILKAIDELKETVNTSIEKSKTETSKQIEAVESKIEEINKALETQVSEWEKKFAAFGDDLAAAKGRLTEFEKTLEVVNNADAVKKSADIESGEPVQKSKTVKWGTGTFSGESLFR